MSKPVPLYHFFSKVAGVSHQNDDGTQRQAVVRQCYLLEKLVLDHQEDNPQDPNAVRICRESGEQLGYLRAEVAEEVVRWAAPGYRWAVYVSALTGGTPEAPYRGVNLLLVRAAPGVGREEAKVYIDRLASEINGRESGAGQDYGAECDQDDGKIVTLNPRRVKGKKKGCGTGLLLAVAVIALAVLGANRYTRSLDPRQPATRLDDLAGDPVALLSPLPNVKRQLFFPVVLPHQKMLPCGSLTFAVR
jgi:hypothetical protein